MNLIKRFGEWILGWVIFGIIILSIGSFVSIFIGDDDNKTKPTSSTKISEEAKLIEIRKTYWENGNIKEETPYKKSYSLGYKKVKTELIPHGISKTYYENGVLESEDPYVEGERTGTMKFYDENGTLELTQEYKQSKKDGKRIYYFNDGTIIAEEFYKDGNITVNPDEQTLQTNYI